nr:hypothetical protein [uncultured Emticicia sp.]
MYQSNFYQKAFEPNVYLEEVKLLASVHGLFEIYPFSNSFIEEFVCHELITFDTRKINLDDILKTIVELLSEWKVVINTFRKAIPTDLIKFVDYTNDVLFVLGGLTNRIFSSTTKEYANYFLNAINEIWLNKLMLDFSKLERLSSNEINYALMVLNERIITQKGNLTHLSNLQCLLIKRLEFIKESNPQGIQQTKIILSKKHEELPLFESFLTNISFQTMIACFIEHQICSQDGKFITKVGGRNPFPSPIMITFLPEILAGLSFFNSEAWESLNLKEKIEILSKTFGVKSNPSFFSNAASKNNRPTDEKIIRFQQLITASLSKITTK